MSACVESLNTDLDFGVINDDLSINIVNDDLSSSGYSFGPGEYKNPLYVNMDNKKAPLDEIPKKELYTTYKHVYALVMNNSYNGEPGAELIFSYALTDEKVSELAKHFTLIKVHNSILYNMTHYKNAVVVNESFLAKLSGNTYDPTEIIIPMYELKMSTAVQYLKQYNGSTQISDVKDTLSFMNMYGNNSRYISVRQLKNQLDNLKDTFFWKNKKNCNVINMTETFSNRNFKYHKYEGKHVITSSVGDKNYTQDQKVRDILNKLAGHDKPKKQRSYELPSEELNNGHKFVDIAEMLKQTPDRTYYAVTDEQLDISVDDVNDMFRFLTNEKELFMVFNTFLTSKNLCHMVVNNSFILEKMQPIINKYLSYYRYAFSYAWMGLYIDECIFKKKTKLDNRFIFDIDTASKLPVFPICAEDLHLNPYVTMPISKEKLSGPNNCLSLKMVRDHDGYGISTLDDFRRKFNIFTTGKVDINIFDGINWDNFAVAGSVTCGCIPKRSPLLEIVTTPSMTETEKYNAYFNNFYRDSDIDLMCNDKSVFSFMDKVNELIQIVKTNISKVKGGEPCETLDINPYKSMAVIIHPKYIEENIEDIKSVLNEPELTVTNVKERIDELNVRDYFYEIYIKYKMESKRVYRDKRNKNELYNAYFKMSDMDDMNVKIVDYEIDKDKHNVGENDFCLYLNDILPEDRKVSEGNNIMVIKISENMKFKLSSPDMLHTIEAFRVSVDNYFSTVSQFHLPCVRSYYDGNNVFMSTSCITAMMTGINMEYKYFAGIRDPIEILLKYQSRGFGTILNENERYGMAYYCSEKNVGNGFFGTDIKNKENINKMYGPHNLNSEIYKVGKHMHGIPDECFQNPQKEYIDTINDMCVWLDTKCPELASSDVDFLKLKCIDEQGNITPYKSWVAESLM